jgi:hypothetical protein
MKRLLAALAALAAPCSLAAATSWKSLEVALAPRQSHEECMRLEPGEERRYSWKATAPVDFNIHYHDAQDAVYPVKRDGMRGDGGSFKPKAAQEYCWMWTAREKAAKLEGKLELGSDPPFRKPE